MDMYNHWAAPPFKRQSSGCCLTLSSGILVLGVVGGSLGAAALTAYAIVQTPTIREQFGPYFNSTSVQDIDSLHRIGYTLEIVIVVLGGILGILSNALLIYGVIRSRRWFLVHWLVFHVFVVIAGLVATILLLLLQSSLYKLYCLIPVGLIVAIILCWVKVYQLFCEMELEIKLPGPCQVHSTEDLRPPPPLGWGGGYIKEWIQKEDDAQEFYPVDKLSRNMQDRMYESPWRDGWSLERHFENTLYCGSESTISSIVPGNERIEYEPTTLPLRCNLNQTTGIEMMDRQEAVGTDDLKSAGLLVTTTRVSKSSSFGGRGREVAVIRQGHLETGDQAVVEETAATNDSEEHQHIGNRNSQESRTDSNLTNAEI